MARGKKYIGTSQCSPHSTPTRTNGPNYPKVLAAKKDPVEVARKKAETEAKKAEREAERLEREEAKKAKRESREAERLEREARKAAKESEAKKKGRWDGEEDKALTALVEKAGECKDWVRIAEGITGRDNKQCLARWVNVLAPGIKKGSWEEEEDEIILEQRRLNMRWKDIQKALPWRTGMDIMNHWNSKLKRRQLDQARGKEPQRKKKKVAIELD